MYTWNLPCDRLGILSISLILPQILPQTSSQTQGNSRVSRMEHQTPSVPGNFRKRKVLGTSVFLFVFRQTWPSPTLGLAALPVLKKGSASLLSFTHLSLCVCVRGGVSALPRCEGLP